jgi:lactate permease
MDVVFSALPVALLIYWMTKRPGTPSNRALPLAALLLYGLRLVYFQTPPWLVHAAVLEGLLTALTPVLIVWGAILLFKTMEHSGAMQTVRQGLNTVTTNPVAQLVIVGWAFSFLIEGVSGFGTPAALAAPLLVGLGFRPLPIAILCLMMNSVPVSFGAVGMPTWFGLGELPLTPSDLREIGFRTALIHSAAAFVIPFLALRVVVSPSQIRANLLYILLVLATTIATYLTVAAFSIEFPSIAGGCAALSSSILLARHGIGLSRAEKPIGEPVNSSPLGARTLMRATFPLWATVLILLLTRLEFIGLKDWLTAKTPFAALSLGPLGELRLSSSLVMQWQHLLGTDLHWSHPVLYVPSLLPFLLVAALSIPLLKMPRLAVRSAWRESSQQILKPLGAFVGALVLVKLLMVGGASSSAGLLGQALASAAGDYWSAAAVYLGALGTFFSGSNTVSNLTFGSIQYATAIQLGLAPTTILSLQSAGGAFGNMVCIHNIVAVSSILGLSNQEGPILRQTFIPMLIYGLIAGAVAICF